jgi:hypothetical protein
VRAQRVRLFAALVVAALAAGAQPAQAGDQLPEPVATWMRYEQGYLDRGLNTAVIDSPAKNTQDQRFSPEQGRTFKVKSYWIDVDDAHAFVGTAMEPWLRAKLVDRSGGRTRVRFVVHPESEALYAEALKNARRGPDLNATATSSSRTLLVWDQGDAERPFFAKTSLDVDIGGLRRNIPFKETLRSVGYSEALGADPDSLPDDFQFFPEVMAAIPRGMKTGGMVIRSIPEEVRTGRARVMPLFSLYAAPPDGGDPILARMIRQSGESPEAFVRDRLVRPFARLWFRLVLEQGAMLSPHAQNVLLEVGADGLPTGRFFYRDLGDTAIDLKYRKQIGRRNPRRLPRIADRFDTDYRTGDKVSSRFANATTYYAEGFLYNIDQRLPGWAKRTIIGPVPRTSRLLGDNKLFRIMFDQELERVFMEMTGAATGPQDPSELEARTEEARAIYVERFRASGAVRPRPLARPRKSPVVLVNRLPQRRQAAAKSPVPREMPSAAARKRRSARSRPAAHR